MLLPGDPHRALAVAQHLLDGPKMFNHTRGLWGYTGIAADGEPLTVQATGMGGPSAAIVAEELIALGARAAASGSAPAARSSTGSSWASWSRAETVLSADGASAALGRRRRARLRPRAARRAGRRRARARRPWSARDLFYDPRDGEAGAWVERGASVVEMEAAAILAGGGARAE